MLTQEQKIGCYSFVSYLFILSLPLAIFGIVVASYFGYLPFKMEVHTVVIIGIIFLIFLLFIPHNAYYTSCKIKNHFSDMEEDLKDAIRKTLLKINGKKKSTMKIESFFEKYFSGFRNDNFASVATTIFPMLGILGTFVAIAISMPDFSVSSTDALDREISVLLGGVGTAFYASIFGIFLSIWWMMFEKRGLTKIEKSMLLVRRAYKKHLWDDISLEHYKFAQNQMQNEELIYSLKENFNIHFMKQFNDSYIDTYKELLEKTKESFSDITGQMKEIGNELKTLSKSTTVIKASEDIDKKVESFTSALERFDSSMQESLGSVDKEVGSIVKNLANFADIVVKKSDEVVGRVDKIMKSK